MKKTVTINIAGIAFTIDEDAYENLSSYLAKIKGYFKNASSQEEIMTDIEARIAEMLQEKLNSVKQVINGEDIDAVIIIMGQPEDYIDDEAETDPGATDSNDENQNTGQTWESEQDRTTRRLFRDRDGNVLGGVCSGLGYYFGFDPIWLRIIFVVTFFLGYGSPFLIYLLLWIVIKEAKTTSEKLRMKGEPVNIDNIGKSVQDEMKDIKNKFKDFTDEAKNFNSNPNRRRVGTFVHRVVELLKVVLRFAVKFAVKIAGVILIFISLFFGIIFIVSLFTKANTSFIEDGFMNFSFDKLETFLFGTYDQSVLFTLGVVFVIGIPLVAMLYTGIRMLFNVKHDMKGFGIAATSVWIIGLIVLIISCVQIADEFTEEASTEEIVQIRVASDTLYMSVGEDVFHLKKRKRRKAHRTLLLKAEDDKIYLGSMKLDILQTTKDSMYLELTKSSRGLTQKEAIANARAINYNFEIIDNEIIFDPQYLVLAEQKWRAQELTMSLYIPVGQTIIFGGKMDRIIYDVKNVTSTIDYRMVGKAWTMTKSGLMRTDDLTEDDQESEENKEEQEHDSNNNKDVEITIET